MEKRLQEMLLCFPWVIDSLSLVADFLLNTLHLYSPNQGAFQPNQLVEPQPDAPALASSKKRRSSPQPDSRTFHQPAAELYNNSTPHRGTAGAAHVKKASKACRC